MKMIFLVDGDNNIGTGLKGGCQRFAGADGGHDFKIVD